MDSKPIIMMLMYLYLLNYIESKINKNKKKKPKINEKKYPKKQWKTQSILFQLKYLLRNYIKWYRKQWNDI